MGPLTRPVPSARDDLSLSEGEVNEFILTDKVAQISDSEFAAVLFNSPFGGGRLGESRDG
jgi:hypothetical protein